MPSISCQPVGSCPIWLISFELASQDSISIDGTVTSHSNVRDTNPDLLESVFELLFPKSQKCIDFFFEIMATDLDLYIVSMDPQP